MRRALASTHISSGGGSLPSASPMSASAPDTGVLGGLHTAQYHASPYGHSGLSRSASEKPASNSRSRSTLGLTSRSISNRSTGSSGNGTFVGDNGNGTGLSTTSTATTVYSPSASPLSVHNDDTLASCAVDLSPERRKMLVDFVDRSVDDAYNLCHGFGSIRWHPAKTREGVSIYRAKGGEMSDDPRLDASVRGKCNVSASFDEMMDTLITETTADFVAHESSVNPAEFLDGQVLCTLVPRTRGDRFVCVKWHCIKSLAPSVAKHRDYVYVEVVDHFTDRDGRKVGFRLSKSVELDELRAFDNSAIFVRGKTLALHTFSQISPGNVELYTMMINDLGERLPPWLVAKIVDTAAMRSACLRDFINQKRMDLMVLARPKEMVPLHKRVCCVVCTRSFSLVRKKYNCVACGDVICNQCSVHQFVAAPKEMISDFVGKKKARICVQCSSNAQRRELPRRASSASSSQMNPPVDKLSEMDHRRGAGSTIGQRRPQSSYYDPHGRIVRSASSAEASISSQESESSRIYPMSDRGYSNRSTIPHMFQFRPAKQAPTVIGGTSGSGGRPSGRSSGMSTSRTSSSPDDDGLLHPDQDDDEEEDDDMEYELEDHHGDGMDFDNLLDESALDRSTVSRHNGAVDLGVGKYRKSYTGPGAPGDDPGDDGEDELTDADDEDTLTAPSTGSSESTLSTNPLGDAVEDEGEELIIEEVMPQGSMDPSGQSPRQSTIRESVGDVHRVSIVKPVVIKQIRKRPAPGAPPKPEGDAALRASSCVISASEAEDDVDAFMSKRESIVTRSRRATLSDESNSKEGASGGTEGEDTIQLADLQIHLDRMTLISESLKKLHEQQQAADAPSKLRHSVSMPVRAASPSPPTLEDQFATISNIGIRAQQEAALAAGFAQAILVESANNSRSSVFVSDIHLMREDGGLCDFLADSSFVDLTASMPEGSVVVPGWVAVHSKTTGKVYYYNESCGSTSWTIPTPDTNRMTTAYMVL